MECWCSEALICIIFCLQHQFWFQIGANIKPFISAVLFEKFELLATLEAKITIGGLKVGPAKKLILY